MKVKNTGFKGFPIGTLAYYGPDAKTVVKAVASIFLRDGEPIFAIQKWVSVDIMNNEKIQGEIVALFKQHGVKSVIVTDGPIGCVHEEGIDYPKGQDCPFCPFWKGKQ